MADRHDRTDGGCAQRTPGESALVWPLGVRLFHGALILTIAANLFIFDEPQWLLVHVAIGHAVLALIVWRVAYGIAGGHAYSRFRQFVTTPSRTWAYTRAMARGRPPVTAGHTPPGGWIIAIFLIVLGILTISGMLALIGEQRHTPLGLSIPNAAGAIAATVHVQTSKLLQALIVVHICGALVDAFVTRNGVLRAAVTGCKRLGADALREYCREAGPAGSRAVFGVTLIAVIAIAGVAARTVVEAASLPLQTNFQGKAALEAECGDCHSLYHPALLPPRSWQALMGDLENHFGEDASLDSEVAAATEALLVGRAAQYSTMKVAYGMRQLQADDGAATIEITQTRFWKDVHDEIEERWFEHPDVTTRSNCWACHRDAATGRFDKYRIRLPERG